MSAFVCLSVLSACGSAPSHAPTTSSEDDLNLGGSAHVMPYDDSNLQSASPTAVNARLRYFDGYVLSHVKVVQVLYGGGTYAPEVSGPQLGNFFREVTQSAQMDWLAEYNTPNTWFSTHQQIGHGTFAGQWTITPSAGNGGALVSDAQIQAELKAQLDAGALPAPDADTLYMMSFPKGMVISFGNGMNSCHKGGFCAYHGATRYHGHDVYYGVLPDMSAGSGCDLGCGKAATPFDNQTVVASHELIEAVTDPGAGLFMRKLGRTLGWYDFNAGEIGDICVSGFGTIVGADGVRYTVQSEFSNQAHACIVAR